VKIIGSKIIFFIIVLLFLSNSSVSIAHAQETPEDSRSITISPLTFELTANPGEKIANKIKVINSGPQPIFVRMEVEDFTAVGESGGVVVQDQENDSFSLAQWVVMSETEFTLLPAEQKIIDFVINVPLEGEPGGHYGSILAVASPPDVVSGGGSGISQKVGSLLLLSVAGEVTESLLVKEFQVAKFLEKPPVDFLLRFENNGSVHVRPRGFVSITNMFGRKEVDIPFPQKNVLPNSVRKLDVRWDPPLALGKYTATLVSNYGTENTPLSMVVSFWIFPWKLALIILVGLIILITIIIRSRRRLRLALRVLFKGDKV
jgi:hypothetical protein